MACRDIWIEQFENNGEEPLESILYKIPPSPTHMRAASKACTGCWEMSGFPSFPSLLHNVLFSFPSISSSILPTRIASQRMNLIASIHLYISIYIYNGPTLEIPMFPLTNQHFSISCSDTMDVSFFFFLLILLLFFITILAKRIFWITAVCY